MSKSTNSFIQKRTWNLGIGTKTGIFVSIGAGLVLGMNAALKNRMTMNLQATPQRMSPTNYPTDKRIPYNHLGTQGLSLALFNRRHNVIF